MIKHYLLYGARTRLSVSVAAVSAVVALLPAAASAAPCAPGSGPNLAGRTLKQNTLPHSLACANLAGANLAGLELAQMSLQGADLQHATLRGTDLTQADLTGVNLAGADLTSATLDQVTARDAVFLDAKLTNASLTQADLTSATLAGADLSGATLTEAETSHTSFAGVKGLTPWGDYVLIGAVALLLALLAGLVRRVARSQAGRSRGAALLLGVAGSVGIAFGAHLFAGALIGTLSLGLVPVAAACTGPQCGVGVGAGTWGIVAGIPVILAGVALRAGAVTQLRGIVRPEPGPRSGPRLVGKTERRAPSPVRTVGSRPRRRRA
jgi:uncharacterized protein YjbI with pentapeptide repeats